MSKPERIHHPELIRRILCRCEEAPIPEGEDYACLKDPCLLYRGQPGRLNTKQPDNYSRVGWEGNTDLAHHVMWEDYHGKKMPEGEYLRHRCDRPDCVQPSHLVPGTHQDNVDDSVKRKRRATGKRNGVYTHPEKIPRGEKHHNAQITEDIAAQIKGALEAMGEKRGAATSIAAHFETTPDVVRGIKYGKNWKEVQARDPDVMPELISRETTRAVPLSRRAVVLTPKSVADIRYRYFEASDREKRHLKRDLAKEFKVSPATIRQVLKRETHRHVAPEIPPINESGSGVAKLTDSEIQQIRATWAAVPEEERKKLGLQAALARHFFVSATHIIQITKHISRKDVPDDPEAAIPLGELPFKPLHRSGEDHPMSRWTEEQVSEMHRLNLAGIPRKEIARRFGTDKDSIGPILRGEVWKKIYRQFYPDSSQ